MSDAGETEARATGSRAGQLLQSGIVLTAVTFLANILNTVFLGVIRRQLSTSEFGLASGVMTIVTFLGLPLAIATTALTHYIARFNATRDTARLQGLLAGCQKFLFHLTLTGSILVALVIKPLSVFFHLPRLSLTLAALCCVLATLWGSLGTALCQGMAWFKRFAFIGLLAAAMKLLFAWWTTRNWPLAEFAVLATAVMVMANLVLLFWRKELAHPGTPVSPWDRDLVRFFIVSAACIGGVSFFNQGDMLTGQRCFPADMGVYATAEKLATALPLAVGPLLTVLFTHRSGQRSGSAVREQFKLLGLYGAGLLFGALCLYLLRDFCVRIIVGAPAPASAALIGRVGLTMVFAGLLQSLGMWALASRWFKISLLYGALGLAYWLVLLCFGQTMSAMANLMPIASGLAVAVLLPFWLIALRAADKAEEGA